MINLCKDCKHCIDRFTYNGDSRTRAPVTSDYLCLWSRGVHPVLGVRDPVSCTSVRSEFKAWENDGKGSMLMVPADCPGWMPKEVKP